MSRKHLSALYVGLALASTLAIGAQLTLPTVAVALDGDDAINVCDSGDDSSLEDGGQDVYQPAGANGSTGVKSRSIVGDDDEDEPAREWSIQAVVTQKTSYLLGSKITFQSQTDGLDIPTSTFNLVWSRNGSWRTGQWDSTVNRAGVAGTANYYTFKPTQTGAYTLYIDAIASDGTTKTASTTVNVWDATGVSSVSKVKVGKKVTWKAITSGTVSGATYNYVWSYKGSWAKGNWGSTVQSTGKATTSKSATFTPKKKGTYYLHVDITDSAGNSKTVTKTIKVY